MQTTRETPSAPSLTARLREEDGGAVILLVAFGMFVIVAAAAFAVDLGKQLRATAEAQSAADAAALAGAGVLATVPDAYPLARAEARLFALQNHVMGDPVHLGDGDVTLYTSSGHDSVKVVVRRTHGSPDGAISSIFGHFLGVDSLEVVRDAIAQVKETTGVPDCPMPFGIPDLWLEQPGGTVAGPNDEFDPGTDVYRSPAAYPNNYTGYQLPRDWGREVVIYQKSGGGGTYNPSWWGPWNPTANASRGNDFQQAVTGLSCGDWEDATYDQAVNTTPGAGQGPSTGCFTGGQGCGNNGTPLIQQDPQADWAMPGTSDYVAAGCTQSTGCMIRTQNGQIDQISASPRIRALPLYDPADVVTASPGNLTQASITNFIGVFYDRVENRPGGAKAVIGYVVGLVSPGEDDGAVGVTTRTVQLVE